MAAMNCRGRGKISTAEAFSHSPADPNVGGGLPPIAVCQLADWALIHRYRGQAPSHFLPQRLLENR
ncbi:hypothetical protein DENIT_12957 [Pseudomonas veronii]|nr:hypothetical protein DENIT_12957 [Pseudomonas veronii]